MLKMGTFFFFLKWGYLIFGRPRSVEIKLLHSITSLVDKFRLSYAHGGLVNDP